MERHAELVLRQRERLASPLERIDVHAAVAVVLPAHGRAPDGFVPRRPHRERVPLRGPAPPRRSHLDVDPRTGRRRGVPRRDEVFELERWGDQRRGPRSPLIRDRASAVRVGIAASCRRWAQRYPWLVCVVPSCCPLSSASRVKLRGVASSLGGVGATGPVCGRRSAVRVTTGAGTDGDAAGLVGATAGGAEHATASRSTTRARQAT